MKVTDTNPWVLFKTHLQQSQMVLQEGGTTPALRIQFELLSSPAGGETQTQMLPAFYAAPEQLAELVQIFQRGLERAGGVQTSPLDQPPLQ